MDDFGPYRIHRELNRGATAIVYEAEEVYTSASANVWQATNSPPVALKIFNERPGGGFTIPISTIQQEIKCASCLRHQNIAQLLNVVPHRDRLGLVFELVRGPDLLDYTKKYRSKMPEELAIHYFRQMVAAVRHMHSNGTVHRDLKPENCMIDPCNHTLKVIDFGLASATSVQCLTGCGTINTMAPECIAMEGVPTVVQKPKAIDIWGLGVTLYIMLSGRYPFQDRLRPYCDESQKRNILNGRMNPLPVNVSSSTRDLVRKLLRSSPDDRVILEDISRHPAMAMPGPIDSVFEEESQMFPQSDGMGSRISSYTSQVSDISPERLRPLTPPLSCDLSVDLDSETSQPNSPVPSSSKLWNVPKARDFEPRSSSTGASPVASRGWKNAGSLPKNWGSSSSFSTFSPSPMSTQAGFRVNTAFSPSQNYKSVGESFSKRQKSVPNMTTSRSNISLSSQLEMIEAALQEDDETDRANYTGGHSGFFDDYDDSDMELGSEFDMGDKAQIGWSSSYSNPSSLSTPQPSLLNNSVEKDLRLSISDEYPSDSFDSASSLPVSPRDCLVQPSPVKLFSINSTDLVSKEDTNKEPSSSTNSTLDFVQHLPPVSTFQPLQPLKKLLSVVHEVPEEMEKEDLDDCEDHCDLAMASLSMQSDTTTYEMM